MTLKEKMLEVPEFVKELWDAFTDTKQIEILEAGLGREYLEEKFAEYLDANSNQETLL